MNKIEKAIYLAILKYEKLRYSELKKIIVDQKKIISERPFRETLNNMVENGSITRNEIDRQNVVYTINKKLSKFEKSDIDELISTSDLLEKSYEELETKLKKLSDVEKAEEILSFLRFLSNQEIQYMILAQTSKNRTLKKYTENIQRLKIKTINRITVNSPYELDAVGALINTLLSVEIFENSKDPIAKWLSTGIKSGIERMRTTKN